MGRVRSICPKSHSFTGPSLSLHQTTRSIRSVILSNMSFFVAFPPNKCLLSAYVVMRSLTSASSHLSRFTVVETSPVNEELQKNFSELFMQHFTRETCTGEKSFEQARISTYYFYMRHIRAAINFLDLALEGGRHS